MDTGRTIFAQLMDFLPVYEFQKYVQRYNGHYKVKHFSCWSQFLCMAFAQLTYRESLRDIEACLRSNQQKLYPMGFRGEVSRNTLAHANQTRDWQIYADFAQVLIAQARRLYANDSFGVQLNQTVYALCVFLLSHGPSSEPTKGQSNYTPCWICEEVSPSFVIVTHGKGHDVNILDPLCFEPGAFYILDRGYLDFGRFRTIHQASTFFVTRTKSNFRFRRLSSQPLDKSTGVQCDQLIVLEGFYSHKAYPDKLRRIRFFDADQNKQLAFLTNNFTLPALTIAKLFQCRWQIEIFFKWIKQHLRIKAFYGTTENAVKTQIWIAIIAITVYVLVTIVKKQLKIDMSLYKILQILSVTLFEKTPILEALSITQSTKFEGAPCNQLTLFD